jgi:transcriptional accessory protein Tex/SPT6
MTDYETIRKDIYESFHDIFHKLYISELKDQIADKDEVITAHDHVIAEQQAEIERLRAALRDVLSYVPHGDMPVTIYDNARAVLEGK